MAETYTGTEGDTALAEGMDILDGTEDRRDGWLAINKTRDYIADALTTLKAWVEGLFLPLTDAAPPGSVVNGKLARYDGQGRLAAATPTLPAHTATKGYVDSRSSGFNGGDVTGVTVFHNVLSNPHGRANTVSSWLNVGIAPDGTLGQTGSARRFKSHIADFDATGNIDDVRVRSFEWVEYPGHRDVGVIAEELADAGYGWLVSYDDEGNALGVAYERLALALIPELQHLRARVAQLEGGEADAA